MAKCRLIKSKDMEVEISSVTMTRLDVVSQSLVGAEGIHLAIATIPVGCSSSPHYHVNCESAIYVVRGKGWFMIGENLDEALPMEAGDFLYVPADAVHQPVNDGTEPLELIVARNTPVEIVVETQPGKPEAH